MPSDAHDIAAIAKGLTKAQYTACWNLLNGEWKLAPHDGWRRAGQACSSLCDKCLAEKRAGHASQSVYRLTPLGIAVRQHLIEVGRV